jgi:hypothetical protein
MTIISKVSVTHLTGCFQVYKQLLGGRFDVVANTGGKNILMVAQNISEAQADRLLYLITYLPDESVIPEKDWTEAS